MTKRAICIFILLALTTQGCLFRKKKDGKRGQSGNSSGLIDRSTVRITRTPEKTSAVVQFVTTQATFCSIAYWSKGDTAEPKSSSPVQVNCGHTQPTTTINQSLSNLASDVTYSFKIKAWTADSSLSDEYTVDEGDATGGGPFGPTDKDVIVMRIDVPLQSAEVHRYRHSDSLTIDEIRNRAIPNTGCRAQAYAGLEGFAASDSPIGVDNMVTRGFVSAVARPHQYFADRLQLKFNTAQFADRLELNFEMNSTPQSIIGKAASQLTSVEVSSSSTQKLGLPQLMDNETPIPVVADKAISVKWVASGGVDKSYVVVQVGRSKQQGTFSCIFDSTTGVGDIDAKLLTALSPEIYTVWIGLESLQVQPGNGTPPWLIASSDWRSTKFEKR